MPPASASQTWRPCRLRPATHQAPGAVKRSPAAWQAGLRRPERQAASSDSTTRYRHRPGRSGWRSSAAARPACAAGARPARGLRLGARQHRAGLAAGSGRRRRFRQTRPTAVATDRPGLHSPSNSRSRARALIRSRFTVRGHAAQHRRSRQSSGRQADHLDQLVEPGVQLAHALKGLVQANQVHRRALCRRHLTGGRQRDHHLASPPRLSRPSARRWSITTERSTRPTWQELPARLALRSLLFGDAQNLRAQDRAWCSASRDARLRQAHTRATLDLRVELGIELLSGNRIAALHASQQLEVMAGARISVLGKADQRRAARSLRRGVARASASQPSTLQPRHHFSRRRDLARRTGGFAAAARPRRTRAEVQKRRRPAVLLEGGQRGLLTFGVLLGRLGGEGPDAHRTDAAQPAAVQRLGAWQRRSRCRMASARQVGHQRRIKGAHRADLAVDQGLVFAPGRDRHAARRGRQRCLTTKAS